jgi:CRP/FNR family transcriptional regulator, cyclic AMP receptor protein
VPGVRSASRDTKVEAMRHSPLFEGLSKKDLAEVARHTEDVDVPAGEVLLKEGRTSNEFFVILDGEAEVTRNGTTIRTLGPGEFFGEIALVDTGPRGSTVTAKTPLRTFVLTRGEFMHLLDTQPAVERKVLLALARRVCSIW